MNGRESGPLIGIMFPSFQQERLQKKGISLEDDDCDLLGVLPTAAVKPVCSLFQKRRFHCLTPAKGQFRENPLCARVRDSQTLDDLIECRISC